jgi:TrmH family RNA methyltransferase
MDKVSQNHFKELKKLHLAKYRYEEQQFLIEGEKIIQEAIQDGIALIKALYLSENYIPDYSLPPNIPVYTLTQTQSEKLTQLQTFPKIMALMAMPPMQNYNSEQNAVFLESIRDPGNLGTIIRICDWYGIPQILLTPDCVDVYNAKTLQSSMGSFLRVKCITIHELPKNKAHHYIADLEGISIEQVSFQEPFILQMGNESKGIQKKGMNAVSVTIPRVGKAESLNVAVATAICLERIRTSKSQV